MTNYFIAIFGNPGPGKGGPVEGGIYPVIKATKDFNKVAHGDVILTYCTNDYFPYPKMIVGQGRVTRVSEQETTLWYEYQEFERPLLRKEVLDCLNSDEKKRFRLLHTPYNWLIQIGSQSFNCIEKLLG